MTSVAIGVIDLAGDGNAVSCTGTPFTVNENGTAGNAATGR